jgi:serine protease Do
VTLLIALLLQDGAELQESLSSVIRSLRDRVAPSTVSILVERFRDPEGVSPRGSRADHAEYYNRPKGPCTGTIVSADGIIATSSFNVSGEIRSILVTVQGHDKSFPAKLLGADREKDIALIKIEAPGGLPILARAPPESTKVGSLVFLIGRAPDERAPTVNFGIVSALHRFGGGHLQYDAELNYGNVGGPVVDARGRLIGIATHIRPRTPWGQSGGVGFALKMAEFDKMVDQLKRGGRDAKPAVRKASLGIVFAAGSKEPEGVPIADLMPDGAAAKAGLQAGDILVELAGVRIRSPADLQKALDSKRPGDTVKFKALRPVEDGRYVEREGSATLGEEEEY